VAVDAVPGAPDALECAGHVTRRAHEHDFVDGPDVDPELERRARDDDAQRPVAQAFLHEHALLAGERRVMRRDVRLRKALAKAMREPLGGAPGVGEDERRAIGRDASGHRLRHGSMHALRVWHHLARERGFHGEHGVARRVPGDRPGCAAGAAEPARHDIQGRDRCRQADADGVLRGGGGGREPLERECEVHAALSARHGMYLVHDHPTHRSKMLAHRGGRQQDGERLRRGDQDVRGIGDQLSPLGRRRIAGARGDTNRRFRRNAVG
jgi:hypothetical protein